MGGVNGRVVVAILVLFVALDVSNASFLSTLRHLIESSRTKRTDSIQVSPSPSPVPNVMNKTSDLTNSNDPKVPEDKSTKVDSNSVNETGALAPPSQSKSDGGKDNGAKENQKKKGGERSNTDSQPEVAENCTGVLNRCSDQRSLTACILSSKQLVILIQNEGEETLKVDLSAPNPAENTSFELSKHTTKKMNLTLGNGSGIVLKSKYGECRMHLNARTSQGNFYVRLPSYDQLVTPVNGAYFLIVTVVIFGGTWACCMFRKRRRQDEITYQELEMGISESVLANDADTAEGWDQGWDDDWDDGSAVKSPAARHTGSISANGLSSRTSNRDGWDNDWDN
ncbi:hypothetical protein K2173_000076 [Erythroxylum novogranatense]|uniref:DUF7356 domain-containing protein n=1 Tax=Erythroxylum novogranatense TaxID=1862640 RepID=A0AAV8SNH5_9ROSI|nr:hypothetical protein K2173_000076 [Erythroxylum novogranatense]